MSRLWMPGAQRADVGDHAPCDSQYPAKAIAHITWDRNATKAKPQDLVPFAKLKSYFTGGGRDLAPHILWDPFTGEFAQFYPANSRSKSVADKAGGTRTNRAGKVVLQIEALFFPYCRVDGKAYAKLADTPCKGWDKLNAWVRGWGVPDTWPMGRPVDFTPHRSEHVWETQGGWYAHAHVPENDHQDPGSWPAFTGAAPAPATVPPFPGRDAFRLGRTHPAVTDLDHQLIRLGFTKHNDGDGYQAGPRFTEHTRLNVADFQRSKKELRGDADGYPGPLTWKLIHS